MSSSDRKPFETSMVLDQTTLNNCHDNQLCQLELVVDIIAPDGSTIRASDRNKYVGEKYYEALLNFPVINRTLGDWLAPEIEFSNLELELSNADGRFNKFMPGGADYDSWIGNSVIVRMGLRDVEATYFTIFKGTVTDQGGFGRTTKSIILKARDQYDKLSNNFPSGVFTKDVFPDIEEDKVGLVVPIIYGDWTVNVFPGAASVPAFPINGTVVASETNFDNVQLLIAQHDLTFFDTTKVYVLKASKYWLIDSSDIENVGAGNRSFEIKQDTGATLIDGANFKFELGDTFYCQVKGKDLGAYDDNIVSQAKDILINYGGLVSGDFHSNWETYRDKASPSESAIASFKSRVWLQEPQSVISYVLSMLEQVRLEAFVDRTDLKFKIAALHFDEYVAAPTHTIRNWDVEVDTFRPQIDVKYNFNQAQGVFNLLPNTGKHLQKTKVYENVPAITKAEKTIGKQIVFPNLYVEADVIFQTKEVLKLASSYFEVVECTLTWRSLLQDIGGFVSLNVQIGSSNFTSVPALIREIGYDPDGLKLPVKLWSFQMTPFPGYTPGNPGTVGGYNATITEET